MVTNVSYSCKILIEETRCAVHQNSLYYLDNSVKLKLKVYFKKTKECGFKSKILEYVNQQFIPIMVQHLWMCFPWNRSHEGCPRKINHFFGQIILRQAAFRKSLWRFTKHIRICKILKKKITRKMHNLTLFTTPSPKFTVNSKFFGHYLVTSVVVPFPRTHLGTCFLYCCIHYWNH